MKKITYYTHKLYTTFFIVLLWSFSAANAQTVHFDDISRPEMATSITGLTVNGTSYDITWSAVLEAVNVFGAYPGTYTFSTESDATAAVTAMSAILNTKSALQVGVVGGVGSEVFTVPFESFISGGTESCWFIVGSRSGPPQTDWSTRQKEQVFWNVNGRTWAIFSGSVGINEELSGVSVKAFPNPADNYITLQTTADIYTIELFNITGKTMLHVEGMQETLDVSAFNAGIYFLKIEDNKGDVNIQKIVIQ